MSPKYSSPNFDQVPYLESAAVYQKDSGSLTIFAVNRSLDTPMLLECDLAALGPASLVGHIGLSGEAHEANTSGREKLVPHSCTSTILKDDLLCAKLDPLSWNVLRIQS